MLEHYHCFCSFRWCSVSRLDPVPTARHRTPRVFQTNSWRQLKDPLSDSWDVSQRGAGCHSAKTSRTFRDPSDESRRDWSFRLISILFELLSVNGGQRRDGAMIIFVSQKGGGGEKKKCQDMCRLPRHTLSFPISLSAAAALTVCLSTARGAAGRRQQVSQPEDDGSLRTKSWLK